MTDAEKRIAIAEACGRNGWWCPQCKILVSEYSLGYQNRHANCTESAQHIPNYLNDLNAMREAEKTLDDVGQRKFAMELITHAGETFGGPANYFAISHATARQRADAFLKTIGKL